MKDQATVPTGSQGLPIRSIRVEVLDGPDSGLVQTLASDRLSVGTDPSNDLVLSDETVSRFHLDLVRKGDRIDVLDHGSTNGTQVGGAWIERASVRSGARLRLGKTSLELTDGETVTLELHQGHRLAKLVGRSSAMRHLMATVGRVSRSDASVLILGETGSGKEVVAEAIHRCSDRADGPFETVDCAAMMPTLIASELFGHEKGAFTGADRQHVGAFERAHGGTLFLDEIGELPTSLQVALLGALERRAFRRVGGKEKISVDVRLVCATNRDLRAEVNSGAFRSDVYYRIAVILLQIPPLRERVEDIPILAEHFLRDAGYSGLTSDILPDKAMRSFARHRWPGNVRELRNAVEAALVVGQVPVLDGLVQDVNANAGTERTSIGEIQVNDVLGMSYSDARGLLLNAFEDIYVDDILKRSEGNISQAARLAGISRQYLTRLLQRRGDAVQGKTA